MRVDVEKSNIVYEVEVGDDGGQQDGQRVRDGWGLRSFWDKGCPSPLCPAAKRGATQTHGTVHRHQYNTKEQQPYNQNVILK